MYTRYLILCVNLKGILILYNRLLKFIQFRQSIGIVSKILIIIIGMLQIQDIPAS